MGKTPTKNPQLLPISASDLRPLPNDKAQEKSRGFSRQLKGNRFNAEAEQIMERHPYNGC